MNDQTQQREPEESPAEIYERHMAPAIFASWVSALVDLLELKRGDQVLDVACGTGLVARHQNPSLRQGCGRGRR